MAIVFHEGLPGSGKSYESVVYHMLPELRNGRTIITNISGINFEKFSALTNIPIAVVRKLIICVDYDSVDAATHRDQLLAVLNVTPDALVLIDEIQNFFPSRGVKFSEPWVKYFSEHRHLGHTIILMGQSFADTWVLIRRRTQRKLILKKLSALGADNSYSWNMFEATAEQKFEKTTSGVRKYDSAFFGLYSSHNSDTEFTGEYVDKRARVFSGSVFKFYIPLFLVAAFFAFNQLSDFFSPVDPESDSVSIVESHVSNQVSASIPVIESQVSSADLNLGLSESNSVVKSDPDPFYDAVSRGRLRVSAYIVSQSRPPLAILEIESSSGHIIDSFSLDEVFDLGWTYLLRDSGLQLTKNDIVLIARWWPRDNRFRTNRRDLVDL